ncbi:MAG: hypothetical protein H6581_15040 [Bacteroidia bacterium]|nr:hypothetical protein [Bacteroidia bacterium]
MKNLLSFLLLPALVLSLQLAHAQANPALSSPKKTFKTLQKAIKNEDLATYKLCWFPKTLESEGMFSKLQSDPKQWIELHEIFKGPQKLINEEYHTSDGIKKYKATVHAPAVGDRGIGTINMVLEDGNWVLWRWRICHLGGFFDKK